MEILAGKVGVFFIPQCQLLGYCVHRNHDHTVHSVKVLSFGRPGFDTLLRSTPDKHRLFPCHRYSLLRLFDLALE